MKCGVVGAFRTSPSRLVSAMCGGQCLRCGREGEKRGDAPGNCKPDSVHLVTGQAVRPFFQATDTRNSDQPRLARHEQRLRSLFGLAPEGVYPAATIARGAVSSYLTFSPLPRLPRAVSFLWHFHPGRGIWSAASGLSAGLPALWCPDFPHPFGRGRPLPGASALNVPPLAAFAIADGSRMSGIIRART